MTPPDKFSEGCERRYQAAMDKFWLEYQQFPKQPDGSATTPPPKKDVPTGGKSGGAMQKDCDAG